MGPMAENCLVTLAFGQCCCGCNYGTFSSRPTRCDMIKGKKKFCFPSPFFFCLSLFRVLLVLLHEIVPQRCAFSSKLPQRERVCMFSQRLSTSSQLCEISIQVDYRRVSVWYLEKQNFLIAVPTRNREKMRTYSVASGIKEDRRARLSRAKTLIGLRRQTHTHTHTPTSSCKVDISDHMSALSGKSHSKTPIKLPVLHHNAT